MRYQHPIVTLLATALLGCCSFTSAEAQVNKIFNNLRKGNFGQAVEQASRMQVRRRPPAPPISPPTPPPPTCPVKPIDPIRPAPILPGPINPTPIIPTPITPNPIIINPGPPIPNPGPPIPSPIVPVPPAPIVTPTPPVVTPPIVSPPVVTPTPPAPTPDPNPNKFQNRPLKFVVQVPAQMYANGTVVPDTNAVFQGMQLDEFSFMPNFSGAVVRPGAKVGEGWMGCTYTNGPFNIPGHGYIMPASP